MQEKKKTFSSLSKKELMDFILTLNKCMQEYEMNIENRMGIIKQKIYFLQKSKKSTICKKYKKIVEVCL